MKQSDFGENLEVYERQRAEWIGSNPGVVGTGFQAMYLENGDLAMVKFLSRTERNSDGSNYSFSAAMAATADALAMFFEVVIITSENGRRHRWKGELGPRVNASIKGNDYGVVSL